MATSKKAPNRSKVDRSRTPKRANIWDILRGPSPLPVSWWYATIDEKLAILNRLRTEYLKVVDVAAAGEHFRASSKLDELNAMLDKLLPTIDPDYCKRYEEPEWALLTRAECWLEGPVNWLPGPGDPPDINEDTGPVRKDAHFAAKGISIHIQRLEASKASHSGDLTTDDSPKKALPAVCSLAPVEARVETKTPTFPPQSADARNQFIYKEALKATPWRKIREAVNQNHEWERLDCDNGAKDAARRFARRYNLPEPPTRRPGRPPGNTKENTL